MGTAISHLVQQHAETIRELKYRKLVKRLIPGIADPPPAMSVEVEVCKRTGIQPSEFKKLKRSEKVSLLESILDSNKKASLSSADQIQQNENPPSPNDARDKWIYDQARKGVPHDEIAIKLKSKPDSWYRITSKQGIRAAAIRYAERHRLPRPPRRVRKSKK